MALTFVRRVKKQLGLDFQFQDETANFEMVPKTIETGFELKAAPKPTLWEKIKGAFEPVAEFISGYTARERELVKEGALPAPGVRVPFALEAKPVPIAGPEGMIVSLPAHVATWLIELVPHVAVQTVQNYREIIAKGEAPPLELPFDPRRLGFIGPIESTGKKLQDRFNTLEAEKPSVSEWDVWKHAFQSSFEVVVPDAFDAIIAGDMISLGARLVLKVTRYDPLLEKSLSEMGLDQRGFTIGEFKERVNATLLEKSQQGDMAGFLDTVRAQKYITDRLTGEGVPTLNRFALKMQEMARDLIVPLQQMGMGYKVRPLGAVPPGLPGFVPERVAPVGLAIKKVRPVGRLAKPPIKPEVKPPIKVPKVLTPFQIKQVIVRVMPISEEGMTIKALTPKLESAFQKLNIPTKTSSIMAKEAAEDMITVFREGLGDLEKKFKDVSKTLTTYLEKQEIEIPTKIIKPIIGKPIPKELEPLAVEARKYKSVEEFVSTTIFEKSLAGEETKALSTFSGKTIADKLTDFYNQAVKGVKEVKPEIPIKRPPSLEKLGLKEKPRMITKPEPVLLRAKLKAEAKGARISVIQYKREQRFLKSIEEEIKKELEKPKEKRRGTISFVRQLGEFPQTAINEVKTEAGIVGPIKNANLEQLLDMTIKLRERLRFKFERGFKPSIETIEKLKIEPRDKPKPEFSEDFYQRNLEISKKKPIKRPRAESIRITVERAITPISTRLKNIDPVLKARLRKFEFDSHRNILKDFKTSKPFLEKVGKIPDEDYIALELAVKNGDKTKIQEIIQTYKLEAEYQQVRTLLDEIWTKGKEVNMDLGYLQDYWPRAIKDPAGFLDYIYGKDKEVWSILDEAIKRKEMDIGRYLTTEEKAHMVNTLIRGFRTSQIMLSKIGPMKTRMIDSITPELNKYYYNSFEMLPRYIRSMNDAIEARRFFGKHLWQVRDKSLLNNLDDSIGAFTADLLAKDRITPSQELELREILSARFGEKGTGWLIGGYKNLAYIDTLGNVENALTQIGDMAFTFYKAGVVKGVPEVIKNIIGKSKITKEDIGLASRDIMAELPKGEEGIAKWVERILRITGFQRIDRLGAESLMNAAVSQAMKKASKPTSEFLKELNEIFPERIFGKDIVNKVLEELKEKLITDNIKFYAFNVVMDFSPRVMSEMPEWYLKGGNGRVFYILKTWTIRMLDALRTEAFHTMRTDKMKGLTNLLRLAFWITVMNGTADTVKDLINGRPIKPMDTFIDSVAVLIGMSRYSLSIIAKDGLASALTEQIQPPMPTIDNLSKDIRDLFKDFDESADINKLRTVGEIPLVGRLYYWWFGRGRSYIEKEKKEPTIEIRGKSRLEEGKVRGESRI